MPSKEQDVVETELTLTERVRARFEAEIMCGCCGNRKETYVQTARRINSDLIGDDLLSRFHKGGGMHSDQLDVIDQWLKREDNDDA